MALSFGYDIGTADSSFIYGQKELKHLDKQYLRSINPEKHMENIEKQREYDRARDQTEKKECTKLWTELETKLKKEKGCTKL